MPLSRRILLAVALVAAFPWFSSVPAQAGQLFPPVGTLPNEAGCPADKPSLKWTGKQVECSAMPSQWEDVPLNSANAFDVNCDYRIYIGPGYYAATMVGTDAIYGQASSRQFVLQKVLSTKKTIMFYTLAGDAAVNTCATAANEALAWDSSGTVSISCSTPAQTPVTRITKRCS